MKNRHLSDLSSLLATISAFYVYKYSGIKKALALYPQAAQFIRDNMKKSFEEVKEEIFRLIYKLEVGVS